MENEWYDVNKTLSYNKLLNFVIGPRGVGKSFGAKKRVIDNFLKKGEQFVYIRRYETELKKSEIEKFFADMEVHYPENTFAVSRGTFYIDGYAAGYYLPLSKSAQYKSVPFPYVSVIIFDEFIIDQGLVRYLPNEVMAFNELYMTIARLRDVTVLFLANAITFTNPYFLYFDLRLQQGQTILKKGDILLELVENKAYTDKAKKTRFAQILAGTDYAKYAVENEFLRDTDTFIEKMNEPGIGMFNLVVDNKKFTVYKVVSNNFWYVSERVDKTLSRVISVDLSSHNQSSVYAKENGGLMWLNELKQKYFRAEIRFTSMTAKNVITNALKK